jgi:hypothetical protein
VRLTIRAAGKRAQRLRRTGRVTVRVAITFRPAGGAARTRHRRLALVRYVDRRTFAAVRAKELEQGDFVW